MYNLSDKNFLSIKKILQKIYKRFDIRCTWLIRIYFYITENSNRIIVMIRCKCLSSKNGAWASSKKSRESIRLQVWLRQFIEWVVKKLQIILHWTLLLAWQIFFHSVVGEEITAVPRIIGILPTSRRNLDLNTSHYSKKVVSTILMDTYIVTRMHQMQQIHPYWKGV